jgi:hypothetical protein
MWVILFAAIVFFFWILYRAGKELCYYRPYA